MLAGGDDLILGDDYEEPWVKELVGANPEKRNWKGIIIAVLVILIVFALITVAVIIVSPENNDKKLGETFTFDDMFDRSFAPNTFDGKWLKDRDAFIYRSNEGEILEYDVKNRSKQLIMDNSTFRLYDTETYFVSPDLQFVLIAHKIEKVFRHSFLAEYTIYNRMSTNQATRHVKFPQDMNGSWVDKKLQFAGWSKTGQSLTFVYDNNLYYQADPFSTPTRVTNSGSENVYNGVPNWLYEEEILHSHVSHWWSDDSKYICYTETDETNVPKYAYPWYGETSQLYGSFKDVAYPKAGDLRENINPVVKVYVLNTNSMTSVHQELQPPAQFTNKEYYVTKITWLNEETLLIVWLNRAQNYSVITLCDAEMGTCFQNHDQTSTGGWVSIDSIFPIDGGQNYLTVLPAREGNTGFWKHIAMISTPDEEEGAKLYMTQGTFEVADIIGYRQSSRTIYYIGTDDDPRKRHIYSVKIPSVNEKRNKPSCMTCDVMGDDCQYVGGSFSDSAEYYILHCQGPGVPQYFLKSTLDDSYNIALEENKQLADLVSKTALPEIEYEELKTKDGQKIWAKLFLPPILNKDHITLFPLLINTYGGPGSQMVTFKFRIGWESYLASSNNIIYAMIDGHGTAARGERWLHSIYKRLGTLEVQDQIYAAEQIRDKYQFVDDERIGIWGSSYGGFVTAHALGDERSDVFNCGISVAPVTDFRYYDTAYTERYLGLINDMENLSGYQSADVASKAQHIQGKNYMLVHGTADDNVHFQNTAQFIKALVDADVDFRVQVYTDISHDLKGQHTSRHLYKTMTNFIRNTCWNGANPREFRKDEYFDVDLQLLAIR